jgi:protein SCO1/2
MRLLLAAALALATPALAHDGVPHASPAAAAAHAVQTAPGGAALPFLGDLGGVFTLTDQTGAPRGQADPSGRPQLLFFGYANCRSICSVALPLMAEIARRAEAGGVALAPVMVTVDPARDTVDSIGPPLAAHHPDFIGLTGSEPALARVYDLFQVLHEVVFDDPEYGPVYAHGSFIYLLDPQGEVLTLIPPILSAEQAARIVLSYTAGG